ncbi:uncharacterized [Tachysurus ichikawai]
MEVKQWEEKDKEVIVVKEMTEEKQHFCEAVEVDRTDTFLLDPVNRSSRRSLSSYATDFTSFSSITLVRSAICTF